MNPLIIFKLTILKKFEPTVKPRTNKIAIHIARVNLYIEKGNFEFSLFLDLVNVNNKIKPLIPVEITHKLEKYSHR